MNWLPPHSRTEPVYAYASAGAFWVGNYSTADTADYEILPSVSLSASVAFW